MTVFGHGHLPADAARQTMPVAMTVPASQKPSRLTRPREWWYATGLLCLVFVSFLLSTVMTAHHPAPGWRLLRAFAEAATVGALADWFAVVALFRAPLGLNWLVGRLGFIGHIAVLPRSQHEIARRAGDYVGESVLTPEMISATLAELPIAEMLSDGVEQNRSEIAGILSASLPKGTRTLGRIPVELLIDAAARRLRQDPAIRDYTHREIARHVQAWLSANPDLIARKVRDQISGIPAETFVARAQAMIGRELQFVRINGTIVGGLVGLLLHGVAVLIAGL